MVNKRKPAGEFQRCLLCNSPILFRPSKPAPRPVVRKNDDYNPSVNRPSAVQNKRPDRDRGGDKGARKPGGGPSNKPSRDPRQADRGDRGRGQQRGDKDKGAAKKEQKVRENCVCSQVTTDYSS